MKKTLIFLCFLSAFSACKKESDPEVDAATKVAGTYQMTNINQNGTSIPLPFSQGGVSISGSIVATRKDANTVNLNLTLKRTGEADLSNDADVTLTKNGSSYDLMEGSTKVGTADGTNLTLDVTDGTDRSIITAKK